MWFITSMKCILLCHHRSANRRLERSFIFYWTKWNSVADVCSLLHFLSSGQILPILPTTSPWELFRWKTNLKDTFRRRFFALRVRECYIPPNIFHILQQHFVFLFHRETYRSLPQTHAAVIPPRVIHLSRTHCRREKEKKRNKDEGGKSHESRKDIHSREWIS